MPGTFGMLDPTVKNFALGTCRIYRPTGVSATPLQLLGYFEKSKLSIKVQQALIQTKLPAYTLKVYNIGTEAVVSADDLQEVIAPENMDMLTGSAGEDVAAWTPAVALQSAYTAGENTLVVTGDVADDIGDPPVLLHIHEDGAAGARDKDEDFIAAKVAVATDTTITLPLGDSLMNDYTTAAVVSRAAYKRNTFGKIEEVTAGQGIFRFSGFQASSGETYKELIVTAHKMVLPRDVDITFDAGVKLATGVSFTILADPSKPNGQQLGTIDVYTVTAP
jgi:hypothetical protein